MFEDKGYDGDYDQAEICANGHVTNTKVKEYPDANRKHCPDCGAATIQNCPTCRAEIVGDRWNTSGGYEVPRFCTACGTPYPWQVAEVVAARALADDFAGLTGAEKITLKASIEDISKDTAMTKVAATRIKLLIPKMTGDVGKMLKDSLFALATEGAKKYLGF